MSFEKSVRLTDSEFVLNLTLCPSNSTIAGNTFRTRDLEVLQLPILLALILAIVGGTELASSNSSKHSSGNSLEQASAVILLLCFVAIAAIGVLTIVNICNLPQGEKRILYVVLSSLPVLVIRLLYTLLAAFENDGTFSIVNGDATVQLCMAVIEELIVTLVFLFAGLVTPALDNIENRAGAVPLKHTNEQKGDV